MLYQQRNFFGQNEPPILFLLLDMTMGMKYFFRLADINELKTLTSGEISLRVCE